MDVMRMAAAIAMLLMTSAEEPVEQQGALRTPVPCSVKRQRRCCGDGTCNGPETVVSCPADCPGVATEKMCGEEPHSDTGGFAVVFGINHRAGSAQDCCDKCREHAANPRNAKRPCNSWVFCPMPICWGLDTGWNHTFGECCIFARTRTVVVRSCATENPPFESLRE